MCSGARDYCCWNGISFDGEDAARRLSGAILVEIESLPEFEVTFRKLVSKKAEAKLSSRNGELKQATRELAKVRRQIERVNDAILDVKGSRTLGKTLAELEAKEDRLLERQAFLQRQPDQTVSLPSINDLKAEIRQVLELLPSNAEFGKRIRELVPKLQVYPYRLCDGGAIVLRAKLVLNLVSLVPDALRVEELNTVLRRKLTVDLFEPPQRERFRERVVALRASGLTERQVAAKLRITSTAAQRAAALQRMMDEQGLTDPYMLVKEPPADFKRLRRHLHRRYRFEPLEGYPDWEFAQS